MITDITRHTHAPACDHTVVIVLADGSQLSFDPWVGHGFVGYYSPDFNAHFAWEGPAHMDHEPGSICEHDDFDVPASAMVWGF